MPAVMKIRDEMAQNVKNPYVQVVGDFLLRYLEQHPEAAEKILAQDKSIKGSLEAMKTEARKHQVDGCGVLTDEEGFTVVLKYYGINGKPSSTEVAFVPAPAAAAVVPARRGIEFDVSLDDLLGDPRG